MYTKCLYVKLVIVRSDLQDCFQRMGYYQKEPSSRNQFLNVLLRFVRNNFTRKNIDLNIY